MSLSDLSSIGSLVSGVAVLVSLVLLFFQLRQLNQQVRQAERNQQASIRHSRITRVVDFNLTQADPRVADAWRRGSQSPDDITQTEVSQFQALCRAMFLHLEDSFYQHQEGLLNEAAYATMLAGTRTLAGVPGVRAAWKAQRLGHAGRFGDFMDGAVARAGLEPPFVIPSVDEWRAAFAAETASA
jgi:hypothetical protein